MKWSNLDGWMDFCATYDCAVDCVPNGGVMVEVGCYLGRSLCYLADQVKASGKSVRVVGVDWGRGSGVENDNDNHASAVARGGGSLIGQLHANLIACGHPWVELIVADSVNAATFFPFTSLDFVMLDARHDYESVKADIRAWSPRLKHGGVLAGDDYGVPGAPLVWPGVKQAVDELLPGVVGSAHDCFWWEKK